MDLGKIIPLKKITDPRGNLTVAEQLQDVRDVEPGDGIDTVPRSRILRICRDDRDMKFWVQIR